MEQFYNSLSESQNFKIKICWQKINDYTVSIIGEGERQTHTHPTSVLGKKL